MLAEEPFRWTDPHTWPFMVWIWAAFVAGGWAISLWKWRRRRIEGERPSTAGRVEVAYVDDNETKVLGLTLGKKQNQFLAIITYSYSVGGETFGGTFKKEFGSAEEAGEYVRDLEGKPIEVRHNPMKPQASA